MATPRSPTSGRGGSSERPGRLRTRRALVITSYQQTIFAYPHGGGSYTVARETVGVNAGLIAVAALMVDYLTTVAVSVTAGVESLIALAPVLNPYRVPLAARRTR